MFTTLASILIVASMVLGGGGAAVFAAQDSLPGQPLYSVKTLGEDLRLDLASGAPAGLALELGYANRRIEEMRTLAQKGQPMSEPLEARYQHHMEAAYQRCANLDDAALLKALEQVRERLQEQERTLQTISAQGDPQAQAALDRVRERVRQQLQLVEDGLRDPQGFRRQIQAGAPFGPPAAPAENGPGWGPGGCVDCPKPSSTPGAGNSYGPGPGPAGTATPGSGYGPGSGDGTCDGCDGTHPQDGGHPEDGTGQQYGPGSQQGPGDGDGDPTCDNDDCDGTHPQDGDGQQVGPGSQQGPGDGGGDGICDGCATDPGTGATQQPASGGSGNGGRP